MNNDKNIIIAKAINKDKSALNQLIKLEEKNILAMLFYLKKDSHDIHDIKQDILLKISNNIHKLRKIENYKTWINQIILNSYYDYLRKRKKYKNELYLNKINENDFYELPDYSSNPQENILNNELDFVIKTSINNLPLRYKIPITLRELEGLSYDEISSITNVSLGTIKSRIARARAIIKDKIDKYSKG